jgi:transcriptional regulator with XRE-family HTH domain
MHMNVSSAHIRAARGLLNWTIRDLAENAGVHRNTVARMEADKVTHGPTIAAMVRALEEAGIQFLNGGEPGVRLTTRK